MLFDQIKDVRFSGKLQERAVRRALKYWDNLQNDITSVKAKIRETSYGAVWLDVETFRNDCEEFSPRAVLCKDGASYHITRRGRVEVSHTVKVIGDQAKVKSHLKFLATMAQGHLF